MLLQDVYGKPEAKFPLDPFWPHPSDCGYKHVHKFEHHARAAAARSLDACRVLMARRLMHAKVDPTWIDFLRHSVIADFAPGTRVGSYFNPSLGESGSKWLNHIPVMVRAHIPVYIVWPEQDRDKILAKHTFLQAYLPGQGARIINVPPRREGWQTMFIK
ncbi:hypothetical protein K466DRAFT_507362, partial [Polyporus arcularius HHB13444]